MILSSVHAAKGDKGEEAGEWEGSGELAVRTPGCQAQHPSRHCPNTCPWVVLQKTSVANIKTIECGHRHKKRDGNMKSGRSFNWEQKGLIRRAQRCLWEVQTWAN